MMGPVTPGYALWFGVLVILALLVIAVCIDELRRSRSERRDDTDSGDT